MTSEIVQSDRVKSKIEKKVRNSNTLHNVHVATYVVHVFKASTVKGTYQSGFRVKHTLGT